MDPIKALMDQPHMIQKGISSRWIMDSYVNKKTTDLLDQCRPVELSVVIEVYPLSVLSSVVATSHMWLLSTGFVAQWD